MSRQQAINSVLNSVVGNNVDNVNVYMEPLSQSDSYYKLSRYDSISSPYNNYWLFFIDDMPEYGWGHDCRYVFINSGDGTMSVVNSHIPPYHYKLHLEVISEHINLIELSPISNLEISVGSNDTVILNWDIPTDATDAVISWSNMIEYDEVGVAAGQCATDQAVRFDKNDLTDFIGWKVTNVSLILSYDENGVQDQHYYVRIWKGEENASEQVYEKEIIDPEFAVPLTVSVDSVVCIEEEKALRIGYYIDKYMMFPWVIDNVPVASEGKGVNYRLYHKDSNNDCVLDYPWDNSWPIFVFQPL